MTNTIEPRKLTTNETCCLHACLSAWTLLLIATIWAAYLEWPDVATQGVTLTVLGFLSIPQVIVAWVAIPLKFWKISTKQFKDFSAAVQYQALNHWRKLTALQGTVSLAALTIVFGFFDPNEDLSTKLAVSLLGILAAAAFYFVAYGFQVKMEQPEKSIDE